MKLSVFAIVLIGAVLATSNAKPFRKSKERDACGPNGDRCGRSAISDNEPQDKGQYLYDVRKFFGFNEKDSSEW